MHHSARTLIRQTARFGQVADPAITKQYPPDLQIEPIHLEIRLHVKLQQTQVVGVVTTTVKARCTGPTLLTLDAVALEAVQVADVTGQPLTWHYDGTKLKIRWQTPFQAQEERRVQVRYQVTQPVAGLYFSRPDAAYPDQPWYAATDHETERARHWLPCIDLPNVRTTLDLYLQAEARFTILANGALISETEEPTGYKTAHWRLEQRCPSYLICFAIGDFVQAADGSFHDGDKSIPVAYYCSPQHSAADLQRTFGRTQAMLAWLTQKLALPFPYPKYYQFALPGISGAMENISLVSWDERFVQDATLAQEYSWAIDQINVHELAHSYFGDAIVCRDFAHAWLKEAWATYIEQLWREDNYSTEEANYVYYMHASIYLAEADHQYKRPLATRHFHSSWDLYDAHLYEGGACRLHTLRCAVGDEIFWQATRDYLRRYNGKVVETEDFRTVLEEHSGRSLVHFFDQWFYSTGYPDLKVTFTYEDKEQRGVFEIEQKQVDPAGGAPLFVLHTDLGWTINGVTHTLPITLDQAKQTFMVVMLAEPELVRFDPNCKILHKLTFNPGDERLRRQLTHAPDVIGRIQAAEELVKTGKRANLQAVVDAYPHEPFWGGRRELARVLGEANAEVAIDGLVQWVRTEQAPMVLAQLLRAAGCYRDQRVREAISVRLTQGLPYFATQAAYEALGAQRQQAPWETLIAGAQQPGFNGIAQAGALRGLAATRRSTAVDLLLAHTSYGATSPYARPAAVSALAAVGLSVEKAQRAQIIEQLIDLLRDPAERVQNSAVVGLQILQAHEAIPALEQYSRGLTHQSRVAVERVVAALRTADKTDGSVLKKQVEDLNDKVRKLEDQLQKLEAQVRLARNE